MGINRHMLLLFFFLHTSCLVYTQPIPEELGDVKWLRTMNDAIELSSVEEKPILILFQEVPGCRTCKNYGNYILSHPLIVEAIETYFIPLCIYNNREGQDAKELLFFNEPAWNNPVVRIIDRNKKDIVARLSGNYSAEGLLDKMMTAMTKSGLEIPTYIQLIRDELSAHRIEEAIYSMYCFWSGEAHFGKKRGIVATEPGFADGKEVVKVHYNSDVISGKNLDTYASEGNCRRVKQVKKYRRDQEPKYYMSRTPLKHVPMTELQKCRINSTIGEQADVLEYLSPRQVKYYHAVKSSREKEQNIYLEQWKDFGTK